jgi:hypothetical protein
MFAGVPVLAAQTPAQAAGAVCASQPVADKGFEEDRRRIER